MENKIAQFVDNYDEASQFDNSDLDVDNGIDMHIEDEDEPTSWEVFCTEIDAWARHAQASNGFGGF